MTLCQHEALTLEVWLAMMQEWNPGFQQFRHTAPVLLVIATVEQVLEASSAPEVGLQCLEAFERPFEQS